MSEAWKVVLRSGAAKVSIAQAGAELTSFSIDGRELMWHADPQFWARTAPILFPVVGASDGGAIIVGGQSFPMPQHGFARDSLFDVVQNDETSVQLRFTDSDATRKRYPFPFQFDVTYALAGEGLSIAFEVSNRGNGPMPYQLGYHPAFVWPFLADRKDDHDLIFASDATRPIHRPNVQGLMKRVSTSSVEAGRLRIAPELFEAGALVFADAASDVIRMTSPSGAELKIETDGFPHWALWTKPDAPFVSIEQWTGLPEWENEKGELAARPDAIVLAPRQSRRHTIRLSAKALAA